MSDPQPPHERYRFSLEVVDPELKPDDILNFVEEALREALAESDAAGAADVALEGGFFGIGELSVVLIIKTAAALAGGAFVTGMGKKAGEFFFEEYLAPKLRRKNLLPGELKKLPAPDKEA